MKVGIIGLGKMGNAIAYRLSKGCHEVIGFDLNEENKKKIEKFGAKIAKNLEELSEKVNIIWLMVPAGKPVDDILEKLLPILSKGSILIDGGNSHFTDSIRRSKNCELKGITFLDCGTSGGLQGRAIGFCLMIGGNKNEFEKLKPIFEVIATSNGHSYIGPSGSGHYIKMIHNGIEYALLESYSEGFNLLKHGFYKNLDLEKISNLWLHGSIIRSWILELTNNIFKTDQNLNNILGPIGGGQTGTWTIQEAQKQNISVPLIEESLEIREKSEITDGNYATKLVAALRHEFGGHQIKKIN